MRNTQHFKEFARVASPAKVAEVEARIEAIEAEGLINPEVAEGMRAFMFSPRSSLEVFARAGSLDGVLVALDVHMSTARAASALRLGGAVAVSEGIHEFYYQILIRAVNSKTITDRHIDVIAHFTRAIGQNGKVVPCMLDATIGIFGIGYSYPAVLLALLRRPTPVMLAMHGDEVAVHDLAELIFHVHPDEYILSDPDLAVEICNAATACTYSVNLLRFFIETTELQPTAVYHARRSGIDAGYKVGIGSADALEALGAMAYSYPVPGTQGALEYCGADEGIGAAAEACLLLELPNGVCAGLERHLIVDMLIEAGHPVTGHPAIDCCRVEWPDDIEGLIDYVCHSSRDRSIYGRASSLSSLIATQQVEPVVAMYKVIREFNVDLASISLLLAAGCDLHARLPVTGYLSSSYLAGARLAHIAARHDDAEILGLLLDAGAHTSDVATIFGLTVSVEQIITGRVGGLASIRCLEMVRQRALESGQGNSYDARYMPWASFPSREDFNILRTYHASMTSLKLVDGLTHGVRFYYIPTVLHALNVVQSLAAASMSIHIMSGNVDNLYTRPYKYASVAKVVYVAYTSSCESAAIEAAYNIAFVYFAAGISAYYGLPIYVGFVFWSVAITSMNVVGFYLETRSPDFNKRSEEAYKNLNSYSSWFSDTQSTSWEDVGTTSTKIEIERPDTLESFTSDVQDDQFVRYGECDLAGETSSEEGCVAA